MLPLRFFVFSLGAHFAAVAALLCCMAEEKSDPEINPGISEDEDSDDEVSLLVVDEDELQTALETAGISIKVCAC